MDREVIAKSNLIQHEPSIQKRVEEEQIDGNEITKIT